jgi:hypothetical protein
MRQLIRPQVRRSALARRRGTEPPSPPRLALVAAVAALALLPHAPNADSQAGRSTPSLDGIGKIYMGREIAGVMGWRAAAWLQR